ncbi:glycoside hydrolase family 31 protein [Lacticaseibacillus parahuelsenbergensis]|uniref:Glycoside hydrolase family 31 protein n=1 Tax=Lacticaseibacillus parahuelsenbergensis TaxID=3068305 RepID=A0ABY9L3A8_9LACO|nr:TIM-barrel domain-containing protein [Lacticaseibacillus sp. NCIMB 15471]WLV77895.1 glycoside hydrolase family 31 protein [Lacticaseibacillus sp. NCIMB 15471]
MHQGLKKRQYRVPRSLLYSSAVLSLTATAVYYTSTIPVSAVKADPGTSKATAKAATSNLQIVSVTKQAHYFEITYSNNLKARLFILADNQFRFYADPSGKFDAPAQSGDGLNAKIFTKTVDTSATKPFDAAQLANAAKGWQIQTKAITIAFDKATATLQVLQGNKVVLAEQQPLEMTADHTTQVLKRSGQDHFFGGGTQNGNFTLTGKKIKIQNTNNWVDGGVASPNPFYWSTAGYGVVRNTFTPGTYDFDAAGDGQVKTTHQEERFDAVYFFDAKPADLLKDYYDLTGAPAMMPRYGFYEAHLNAYNRDTWVPVSADTPGAIKFEDGKYYKEYQPGKVPAGQSGIKESLNGELNNYQFSARAVIDRYAKNDMPLGWLLPNDGYGAGYGQTDSLAGNLANLKEFADYADKHGVATGLWTQQNLSPVDPAHPKPDDRDFAKEVANGVKALKTDVAWVGSGYSFGLDGLEKANQMLTKVKGDDLRPFAITLDGWAGTQRYAGIWTGDQTGGQWEYIRFHIPTYIGTSLSGQPYVGSDMDGIFGGGNPIVNARDFQWKAFTPIQLNMDGWGSNPKTPFSFDDQTTAINRAYNKQKTMLMPYNYTASAQSVFDGKPMVRGLFLDYPEIPEAYTDLVKYEYLWGDNFLVAPIYQNTAADDKGNDVRNGIYLPDKNQVWVDYYTGKEYRGGQVLNNFDAPIWKLPGFVKKGAVIPTTPAHNTPKAFDQTKRQFQIFPAAGKNDFTVYEDDGISQKYLKGAHAQTKITSELQKDQLEVTVDPLTGDYSGLDPERTSEFAIRTSGQPKKVTATVGGKAVTLKAVDNLQDYEAGSNVYFVNKQYHTNTYLEKLADKQIDQNFLQVKLDKTNVKTNAIKLTVSGIDATDDPTTGDLPESDQVPVPTDVKQDDKTTTDTAVGINWSPVKDAASYDVKADGVTYRNLNKPAFVLDQVKDNSKHTFQVRTVTTKAVSKWSTEQTFSSKENPMRLALKMRNPKVTSPIKDAPVWQGDDTVDNLFDQDLDTMAHSNWFSDTPKQSPTPMTITTELDGVYDLDHVTYVPRENGGNGNLSALTVETSLDSIHWHQAGEGKGWKWDSTDKTINFSEKEKAKYVRFVIPEKSTVGDFVSGRELLLFKRDGTNKATLGDITNDGQVNDDDKTSLMNYAGLTANIDSDFNGYVQNGDLNRNGVIDAFDINYVMTKLGKQPVTKPDETTPAGTLALQTDKPTYVPGDTITLSLVGNHLDKVNSLFARLPLTNPNVDLVKVEPTKATANMVNFSKIRTHGDNSRDVYLIFANEGQQTRLSGDQKLATITLKTKTQMTKADLQFALRDLMLTNQWGPEALPQDPSPVTVQQSASEQAQAKTKLTALLDAVHALDPKLFTATSWQAVATASDTAAQLVKDDTASTDALTKAYTDLQKALQQLEADRGVTQAQLKGLINAAEALKSDAYTADSFAKLQAAVAAAKPVNADEHATQVQIQSAIQAITAAWVALELKPQPTPVTDLAQWLQVAAALKADDYTPASYAKLTDAITAGKKVAADPNASTAAQQAAVDQLKAAIDALVPRANKQLLEAVIATADKLSASAYTASSYAKLQAAVKAARPLLTDLNATQAAVAEQTNAVLTALQQLVKLPDKTELVKLITQAAGLKKDAYTEASFNDVQTALAQARTVQKDPESTEAQVAKAAADLKTAIDHLVKAAPEPDKKDPATPPVPAPNPGKKDPATPTPKPAPGGGFQGGQPTQSGKTPESRKETNDTNTIPKTGEQTQSVLAVLGAALIGLLGYVKLRKHKHE